MRLVKAGLGFSGGEHGGVPNSFVIQIYSLVGIKICLTNDSIKKAPYRDGRAVVRNTLRPILLDSLGSPCPVQAGSSAVEGGAGVVCQLA